MASISDSALAVARILMGQAPDELPPLVASEAATETVWLVAREQSKYWRSVDPKSCEPQEGQLSNVQHSYLFLNGRRLRRRNLLDTRFAPVQPVIGFIS